MIIYSVSSIGHLKIMNELLFLKKATKELQNWVFDVAERLGLNPMPKNSKIVTNSPYE